MKKIIHLKNDCISCEACVDKNPKHWEMDAMGLAHLKGSKQIGDKWELLIETEDVPINVEAAEVCPVDIISVITSEDT